MRIKELLHFKVANELMLTY